ncbi:lysis system i-spanin subunit Rz [Janthinobacterium fluminis]|uniref:Lysis system i-spanin subunit Rz n=1 Tax=Janthinobacterium fluminis TaxID=2987524 RepID=A0ABT5JZN0_9BURK|nr:lysis system i-spanin subunit Rz [Janthinobacterium fluminis]MDC8757511.1 lysis system i-spanin subunit Rz [Janthinobacterium fluminis]
MMPLAWPGMALQKCLAPALGMIVGAMLSWTVQGWRKDATIADLRRAAATSEAAAATRLAQATGHARELERAAALGLDNHTEQFKLEMSHAQAERDRFIADVRGGAVRLSIPVAGACAVGAAYSAPAGEDSDQARAELNIEAAAALGAIAGDGDDAARQLNACIDAYNSIREQFNVQAQ